MPVLTPRELLRPFELVARTQNEDRKSFEASFEGDRLLLVTLGTDEGLLRGLMECPTGQGDTWYPRSDATGTATLVAPMDTDERILSRIAPMPPPFDGATLGRLISQPHFAMPLRKRKEAQMRNAERISVGRSHANDVVLFHDTVSKLHAWFECDDRSGVYVCDSGSTNLTRVRGQVVTPHELVHFSLGDEVRFGSVSVRIIAPQILWDALQGT